MNLKLASEQNAQWVGLYSKVLARLGVFTFSAGLGYATVLGFGYLGKQIKLETLIVAGEFCRAMQLAIYGLLALALADLLAHVAGLLPHGAGTRSRKTWLLHHADIGLYLLAGLGPLDEFLVRCYVAQTDGHLPWQVILFGFASLVKATVLVALGLFVRRALPIITESRTLV